MELVRFTVSGFRGFSKAVAIDLRSSDISRPISSLIVSGPSGSGKTNMGLAMFSIVSVLTDKWSNPSLLTSGVFLNLDADAESASFHYSFVHGRDSIVFEYEMRESNVLARERFAVNDHLVFDYDHENGSFLALERGWLFDDDLNFEYLGNNLSVLRYITHNTIQNLHSPIRGIMDYAEHMLWFRPDGMKSFIGFELRPVDMEQWIIENDFVEEFSCFLSGIFGKNPILKSVAGICGEKLLAEMHGDGCCLFRQTAPDRMKAAEVFYFWMKRFRAVSLLYIDDLDLLFGHDTVEKLLKHIEADKPKQVLLALHSDYSEYAEAACILA